MLSTHHDALNKHIKLFVEKKKYCCAHLVSMWPDNNNNNIDTYIFIRFVWIWTIVYFPHGIKLKIFAMNFICCMSSSSLSSYEIGQLKFGNDGISHEISVNRCKKERKKRTHAYDVVQLKFTD